MVSETYSSTKSIKDWVNTWKENSKSEFMYIFMQYFCEEKNLSILTENNIYVIVE